MNIEAAFRSGAVTLAVNPTQVPNPDRELIALCDKLVKWRTYSDALLNDPNHSDDEEGTMWDDQQALVGLVFDIPSPRITTMAGAKWAARALAATSERDGDGDCKESVDWWGGSDWLALDLVEFLAGGALA